MPDNVTVKELDLFQKYFFEELLELHDFELCQDGRFLFMPRFVRDLPENGKEILSMNKVMSHLLEAGTTPLVDDVELMPVLKMPRVEWENEFVDKIRGQLVQFPGMKPPTLRVDQLDREQDDENVIKYPEVVHFGTCPPQMCYAGNGDYMKAWRDCVKFRHLLANMPKPTISDRRKLHDMEAKLIEMRSNIRQKRDVAVAVSSQVRFYSNSRFFEPHFPSFCDLGFLPYRINNGHRAARAFATGFDRAFAISRIVGLFRGADQLQVQKSTSSPTGDDSSLLQRKFWDQSGPRQKCFVPLRDPAAGIRRQARAHGREQKARNQYADLHHVEVRRGERNRVQGRAQRALGVSRGRRGRVHHLSAPLPHLP